MFHSNSFSMILMFYGEKNDKELFLDNKLSENNKFAKKALSKCFF